MPLPMVIPPLPETANLPPDDTEDCGRASTWLIELALWFALRRMAGILPYTVRIISGYRTVEKQRELIEGGRGAPDHLSTHRRCPAIGADLDVGVAVTREVKLAFGEAAQRAGLRWGGGSKLVDGIPWDWNHVDLGPRASYGGK